MRRHVTLLVLLLVCGAAGAAAARVEDDGGSDAGNSELEREPARTVQLVHGAIQTTRDLLLLPEEGADAGEEARRRRLYAAGNAVWLLGLPAGEQEEVRATVEEVEGRLLHPLPDGRRNANNYHWLVLFPSSDAVKKVLAKHTDVTAAVYPLDYKLSTQLLRLQSQKASARTADSDTALSSELASSAGTTTTAAPSAEFLERLETHLVSGCLYPLYILNALTPGLGAEALLSLAAQTKTQLVTLYGEGNTCLVEPRVVTEGLLVMVLPEVLTPMSEWLAEISVVTWVSPQYRARSHNLVAGAATQRPDLMRGAPPPDPRSNVSSFLPLWNAGLDGTGQVIGLMDSGLDMDSCYLWDPTGKDYQTSPYTAFQPAPSVVSYTKPQYLGDIKVYKPSQHRKLTYMAFYQDTIDDPESHGTNVATTLVGSVFNTSATEYPDQATGVAPGAKLAFIDVGRAGDGDSLTLPRPLSSSFEAMRMAGARILSNSWGTDGIYTYEDECAAVDQYLRATPDVLVVFSGGNDGDMLERLDNTGSVSSPGICKNVLTVGATESWLDKGVLYLEEELLDDEGKQVNLTTQNFAPTWSGGQLTIVPQSAPGQTMVLRGSATQLGLMLGVDSRFAALQGLALKLRVPTPVDACTLPSGAPFNNTVLLVSFGDVACKLPDALANVVKSGAAGVLLYNPGRINSTRLASARVLPESVNFTTFPAITLRASLGIELSQVIRAFADGDVVMSWSPEAPWEPVEHVADFSSFGSAVDPANATWDARYKPDIVAPGYVMSARSDGEYSGEQDQCDTIAYAGTSMATPVVAGAAALVRSYFTEGFYPSGAATRRNRFQPSAALLKAVLLAGAASMTGLSRINLQPLAPAPSPFQGFGRLDLQNTLPLKGVTSSNWRMQVIEQVPMTYRREVHQYEVVVDAAAAAASPSVPLIAMLAWQDYQGYPGQSGGGKALINDLDLFVNDPSGQVHWGNGVEKGDLRNNVEKVRFDAPVAGTYTISVRFIVVYVASVPQTYSLVVLGAVNNTISSPYNPAQWSRSARAATPERVIATAAGNGGSVSTQAIIT